MTLVGAAANLLLTAVKGAAGVVGGSGAMVADAIHSLSDLASDLIALVGLRVADRPPDASHPYGHGRFETLGTVALSAVLLVTAGGIALQAIDRFGDRSVPGVIALWAAGLSIVVKEALYQVTRRVGERHDRPLVVANAWHHRSDALSSIAALGGIAGARAGFPILDPVAAFAVAALIAAAAIRLLIGAVHEITDRSLEADVLRALGAGIRALPGVVNLHELRARRMGSRVLVDLHVEVDGATTVSDGHQVAERVRAFVLAGRPASVAFSEVLVHIDPEPDQDRPVGASLARPRIELERLVRQRAERVPGVLCTSHVIAHFLGGQVGVQVHIEVDPELTVREATEIGTALRESLEALEDIHHADIHLELDDRAHAELPPDLRALRDRPLE